MTKRIVKGDEEYLEKVLDNHSSKKNAMASLRSRFVHAI